MHSSSRSKKLLPQATKKERAAAEKERAKDFCLALGILGNQIKALGSQDLGCGHIHQAQSVSSVGKKKIQNLEEQIGAQPPENPVMEIEEAEDLAIQIGKMGEIVTSLGGALVIGPILDLIINAMKLKAFESFWFAPNDDLETSPAALMLAFVLIMPAVYGAQHCHANLEIASRTRNNFFTLAQYTQRLWQWGDQEKFQFDDERLSVPFMLIGEKKIPIDHFVLIDASDAASLSLKETIQIFGDVQQHYNEYIGLTIIAILRNIQNPIMQYLLICTALIIAAVACKPEVMTCWNTLTVMNEFKKGKIIDNTDATNTASCLTTFSAFAKTPAVFYANLLSFQQICFGNFYAGMTLALLATMGNIITQYFINVHTETLGEAQSTDKNTNIVDDRKPWEKLTLFGKSLVVARAMGTGNERAEPITLIIIAMCALGKHPLSSLLQSLVAFSLFVPATSTAYSEARNAADHMARVGFFTTLVTAKSGMRERLLPGVVSHTV